MVLEQRVWQYSIYVAMSGWRAKCLRREMPIYPEAANPNRLGDSQGVGGQVAQRVVYVQLYSSKATLLFCRFTAQSL